MFAQGLFWRGGAENFLFTEKFAGSTENLMFPADFNLCTKIASPKSNFFPNHPENSKTQYIWPY